MSKIARDILAIPVTTVVSDASFKAGGRVIEEYLASDFTPAYPRLDSHTLEALVVADNSIR